MPRFALLRHDSPRGRHWDLLLEAGAVLRTWQLPARPQADKELDCRALADHRLRYLDYEGPLSGGRGSVVREDAGTYEPIRESGGELVVELRGQSLGGRLTLKRLAGQGEQWQLRLEGCGE